MPTDLNFYKNQFIFDRHRAKNKLARFFLTHGVESYHLLLTQTNQTIQIRDKVNPN